jgi:transcriptional regulator NrdR family protein
MQLKVIKADGSVEEYLHTKVIGTINNALSTAGQADIIIAEEFAEAVTYFLHQKQHANTVSSSEILSMIQVVLAATEYEEAAAVLSEHHFERKLKRSRIEVVSTDIHEPADAARLCRVEQPVCRTRWDKTKIVEDLTTKYNIDRQTARTIASMVEEKILNMGASLVPVGLIKQLVLSDTAAVLRAQHDLATV